MRKFLVTILFVGISLFSVSNVYAKKTLNDADSALDTVSQKTGIDQKDFSAVTGNVVNMIFIFVGLIFFALMVYAGLRWMTARDQADKVEKARNTMIAAVIGLIIVVAAYAITNFLQTKIINGG
ncbi:MAG: hypothetical protein COX80_03610 [Candidatus Magasanikbacteria bacterium CG_4_10_14_0_2_um_filter_33_14]|uniref:DUF4134 domain-containing protein n=1 Tax=Candidatus Magasanikbacteria bacterium CG_4_10_14_0_2_um_filter_33_14 TaxID=1974636 RepID=A0A2M7VA52_9BACT|nr:MAG: hypothetical protein COX80_03610 [Candidatus Magasanikbacteria bacterium CG_4_10_14_0_2_um_filter_33_14]